MHLSQIGLSDAFSSLSAACAMLPSRQSPPLPEKQCLSAPAVMRNACSRVACLHNTQVLVEHTSLACRRGAACGDGLAAMSRARHAAFWFTPESCSSTTSTRCSGLRLARSCRASVAATRSVCSVSPAHGLHISPQCTVLHTFLIAAATHSYASLQHCRAASRHANDAFSWPNAFTFQNAPVRVLMPGF